MFNTNLNHYSYEDFENYLDIRQPVKKLDGIAHFNTRLYFIPDNIRHLLDDLIGQKEGHKTLKEIYQEYLSQLRFEDETGIYTDSSKMNIITWKDQLGNNHDFNFVGYGNLLTNSEQFSFDTSELFDIIKYNKGIKSIEVDEKTFNSFSTLVYNDPNLGFEHDEKHIWFIYKNIKIYYNLCLKK